MNPNIYLQYRGNRDYIRGADILKNFLALHQHAQSIVNIALFKITNPIEKYGKWCQSVPQDQRASAVVKWKDNRDGVFTSFFIESGTKIKNRSEEQPKLLSHFEKSDDFSGVAYSEFDLNETEAIDFLVEANKALFEATFAERKLSEQFIEFVYLRNFTLAKSYEKKFDFRNRLQREQEDKHFLLSSVVCKDKSNNVNTSEICFSYLEKET